MFDEALGVYATLRSPEFRAAFAERWIQMFRIGPAEAARVREQILAEGAGSYEFHVETVAHAYELNEFTTAKSVWRLIAEEPRIELFAESTETDRHEVSALLDFARACFSSMNG